MAQNVPSGGSFDLVSHAGAVHRATRVKMLEFIQAQINGESNYDSLKVAKKHRFLTALEKPKDRFICTSH